MDKVQGLIDKADKVKPKLDNEFKLVAMQSGLNPVNDYYSRLKNKNTILKKIGKHVEEGKDYSSKDVNDVYGGRFVTKTPQQKKQLIEAIQALASKNEIKITKQEEVKDKTYNAYHIDFIKNGVKGEIQIHDPSSLFEAVVNHPIRDKYGEQPPQPIEQVKRENLVRGLTMPQDQAQQIAQAIEMQRGVSTNGL